MTETTNIGAATADTEVKEHGPRKDPGRYLRFFLIPLIALAFFAAVSAAAPREALAAGSGWYWTNHNGQQRQCFWIYNANGTWTEDGCKFYYGGSLPAYYEKFATGQVLVDVNGTWQDTASYWRSYSTITLDFNTNRQAYNYFANQVSSAMVDTILRSTSSRSRLSSEAPQGSEVSADSGTPRLGSKGGSKDLEST